MAQIEVVKDWEGLHKRESKHDAMLRRADYDRQRKSSYRKADRWREGLELPTWIHTILTTGSDEMGHDRQRWTWVFASSEGMQKFGKWFPEFKVLQDKDDDLKRQIKMAKDNYKWDTWDKAWYFLEKRVDDIIHGIL